ncbi:MAG: SDR family NAD(P)-dependent oxidoreductase [Planctomycetota bacterium]
MTALDQKVVLVTGGASGIGKAVVSAARRDGARVASLDVTRPDAASDEEVLHLPCDVRSSLSVDSAVEEVISHFGGIDGLVQCAGITRDGVLWKMQDDDWRDVLDVNLTGAFVVLRAVVPTMRARGGGAVVNVTSINGLRGKFGQSNYTASKAGLIGFTKTAARELGAFGIRVNAVAPGMVRTPMIESLPAEFVTKAEEEAALKRISEPEDIADAVVFLLSDAARQITGETLRVDGGQYM